jgi:hypothetical protein
MLKVNFELGFAESAGGKIFPSPMMLVVHDPEERFKKRGFFHVNRHDALPSRGKPRYNSDCRGQR